MGEPAGIGGELALTAWLKRNTSSVPSFFLIDDPNRMRNLARLLSFDLEIAEIEAPGEATDVFPGKLPVLPLETKITATPGKPDPANAVAVIRSIRQAVDMAVAGDVAAVVTNPIHKQTLVNAGFEHPGHTEYLAHLTDALPVMMLVSPDLRVVPFTTHVALKQVADLLTIEGIVDCGRTVASAMTTDFGIAEPRLAISGLNPHAGEGGVFGREEIQVIAPAIRSLVDEGIIAAGPYPADSLFRAVARDTYDAVICMYHDQALIPLKTLDFERGVNVTLGLPIIRTSPDHGTALELAGTGQASCSGLISALKLAHEISINRARDQADASAR